MRLLSLQVQLASAAPGRFRSESDPVLPRLWHLSGAAATGQHIRSQECLQNELHRGGCLPCDFVLEVQ